ncbi:MAG: polyprenyl synthetase family protein [Dehalococcoidia bacterium]|nr:polyprenyl synthetase family protein [Dehalococcoidia bacterium]
MMRYHMGWVDAAGQSRLTKGGKLLRPALCLLSCESVGGDWHKALPAAAAIEILHNFSLVHDDIEDGDRERRGIPTVWSVWGEAQGINTGDAMHVLARLALLDLEQKGIDSGKVILAARLMDATCLKLCEGQYLDISYENRLDIGINDYLRMIGGKTAALFSCSLKMGALLGTDDEQIIEGMAAFGQNLGMAFQIQDDVLGIWGQEKVTGKPVASDILKKKKTLPVIFGIENAALGQKENLLRIYGQQRVRQIDIPVVLEVLDSLEARQHAAGVAGAYFQQALTELDDIAISPSAKGELRSLAEALVGREY